MNAKRLLVLAASAYQVETIRVAKRLGYSVITLDNRPENPGHLLADKSFNVDTTDCEGVLEIARREKIDGVLSPCTDVAVPTAAAVAQELGLPGPPPAGVHVACSKMRFREFQAEHGLPHPEFVRIDPDCGVDESLFGSGCWLIKPDQSSGSKGIVIVRSKSEFLGRLRSSLEFSPTGAGVLERFIDGFQGTCEGILHHGAIAVADILDRETAAVPYVTTCGHFVPTKLRPDLQHRLLGQLEETWRLLGVTDGVFDCDFVASADEVYILELSPRMGGNCIASLLRLATGFDYVEYGIRHALGDGPILPSRTAARPCGILILGVDEAGSLFFDAGALESLRSEPWVDSIDIDCEPGASVLPFVNSRHRVGQAMFFAGDRASVETRAGELKHRLGLRAVPKPIRAFENERRNMDQTHRARRRDF